MSRPSADMLRRVPLFADLERRELERFADSFKERRFSAGDTVSSEGGGAAGFFVIAEGTASVSVGGKARRALEPGDYFGEIALIDEGVRTATIKADTALVCYGMPFWEFRPIVEANAQVAWKLLQALARKLRAAEQSA